MIKVILFLLVALLFNSFLFGQHIHSIDLNFNDLCSTDLSIKELYKISRGDFYRVKITGINTYLYNISINAKDSILQSTAYTMPTFGSFSLDPLKNLIASFPTAGISTLQTKSAANNLKNLIKNNDTLNDTAFMEIVKSLPIQDTESSFNDFVSVNLLIINQFKDNLYSIKLVINELIFKLNSYRLSSLVADQFSDFKKQFTNDTVKIDNAYKFFEDIRQNLQILYANSLKTQNLYVDKVKSSFSSLLEDKDNSDLKTKDQNVKDLYSKLLSTIIDAQNSVSADSTFKYLSSIIDAINNKDYTYTSLPIQFNNDQSIVSINITPRTGYNLPSYSTKITLPIYKKLYSGITTGLFFSYLHDDVYSYKKTITTITSTINDTSYKIIKENPGTFEIGVNSMFKIGYKLSEDCGLQVGFGPGISVSKTIKPRLLIGGGISIGRKNMLLINIGQIWGNVDELSNEYNLSDSYHSIEGGLTSSHMKGAFYFSFEYLFDVGI